MTRDKIRLTQTEFDRCIGGEANKLVDTGLASLAEIVSIIKKQSFVGNEPADFEDRTWKQLKSRTVGLTIVADFAKRGPFDPEVLDELKRVEKRINDRDTTITAEDFERIEKNLLADRSIQVTKCLIGDPEFNEQLDAILALKRIDV